MWELPLSEGGDPVTGYNVYSNGMVVHTGESTMNTYTFNGLSVSFIYELSVSAFNDIGESQLATLSLKAASVPQKQGEPVFVSSTSSEIEISANLGSFNGGDSIL